MVDRSVSIGLEARVTGFVAGVRTAQAAVTGFTAELDKSAKKRAALQSLGATAGKVGLVAAAGLGVAIATAANFDQAMSRVQGATGESAKNMEALRTAAINAGRDTVFSATDAASAEEEMAKAGVKTADILGGGLTGALNLASAGTLDVGTAAGIAATTMNQFGLAGSDVTHIADVLAATAGKAQGDVTDMAEALKYVGPVASQMGVSLEQTAGSIGLLASQGILGSQAGTSLRGMLTALTSPSKSAAKEMDTLGISMYDAKGNFVGLDGIAGQLHDKMSGLSNATRDQALGQIFGNQQITAARILYAGGAQAVDQWSKKVNDSGYAARLAGTKMNNLKGDLEQLKGSLETALIGTGEGAQGPLRGIVRGLTDVVNAYSKLPAAAQGATAGLLGITAVTGGSLWFGAKVIGGVVDTKNALSELSLSAPKAAGALRALGTATAVVGGVLILHDAIDALEKSMQDTLPTTQELAGRLLNLSNADAANIGKQFDDLGGSLDYFQKNTNTTSDVIGKLTSWAPDIEGLVGSMVGFKSGGENVQILTDQFAALDNALASIATTGSAKQARDAFASLAASQHLTGDQQAFLLKQLPQYRDALAGASNQAKLAGGASKEAAGGVRGLGNAAGSATTQVQTFKDALSSLNGLLSKHAAIRDYQAAIDDFQKSFKHIQGDDFNVNVDPGRQNQAKLEAIASAAGAVASSLHGVARVQFVKSAIAQLRAMAANMHLPQKEVADLIKALLGLDHTKANPPVKVTGVGQAHRDIEGVSGDMHSLDKQSATPKVRIDTSGAMAAINSVLSHLAGLDRYTATPHVTTIYGHRGSPGAVTPAAGGHITGPGTGTSDSIPAMVSNGEYVVKTAAVEKYGVNMMHRINSMQFSGGGSVGRQMTWSAGGSGSVRLAGPVEIRGRVDLDTGRLIGTMHAIADQHIDDDHSFSRAMAGRLS